MGLVMRAFRKMGLALVAAAGLVAFAAEAAYAQPAGLDAGKDCHNFRTCNFGKRGNYRGCLSTYACKACKFVTAPCTVDGQRKVCQRLRCGWGASS